MSADPPSPIVRGWCPGVLTPMEAADGLLLRVRLPGGAITPAALRVVSEVAEQHGSGVVELTARANLQVRGIRAAVAAVAGEAVVRAGLADADPVREARRNVVGSPLAGHDPAELVDISPVVERIASGLAADAALDGLPPKFTVVVDGGGAASVRGVPGDVAFGAVHTDAGVMVAVVLGGALDVGGVAAWVSVDEVEQVALVVARTCARRGDRMADVVTRDGVDPTIRALGVETTEARQTVQDRRDARRSSSAPIGVRAHSDPARVNIGAAPVVGRTDPGALRVIATLADTAAEQLRVTPWRGLVLLGVPASDGDRVVAELARVGWSADHADRRHLASACVGRDGCTATVADTIGAAESWITTPAAGPGPIHFAGCDKRCGAGRVPVVVASSDGTFAVGSS